MQLTGKLVGAFFGFILGGPFGLLLGLFLGHKFDAARSNIYYGGGLGGFGARTAAQQASQAAFFHHAFAVMGHVAKSKGHVTEKEIQVASHFMQRMGLHGEARRQAQAAFRDGKESDFPLDSVLEEVRAHSRGRPDLLQFFVELQIQAAYADGELQTAEREILYRIAAALGFSAQQLEQRLAMQEAAFRFQRGGFYSQQQGQSYQAPPSRDQMSDAYKLLGVDEQATPQTLKRAYRKLMNEHHPDKLVAKGLPPEMMEVAKQKAQEIQAAYDMIKKEKGLK
ncbi:co-chaperone DjlA [Thaumasiovibrio sp. DFM-14]|uniref:co-chaperone DjlA n=1 Tax=Thaumasiovibrio sp. DFM-14 TaxID=3384792 RepID=UPI0039A1D7FF